MRASRGRECATAPLRTSEVRRGGFCGSNLCDVDWVSGFVVDIVKTCHGTSVHAPTDRRLCPPSPAWTEALPRGGAMRALTRL
jgi:hypothetical protein